jgi:hypothetical protein
MGSECHFYHNTLVNGWCNKHRGDIDKPHAVVNDRAKLKNNFCEDLTMLVKRLAKKLCQCEQAVFVVFVDNT